MQPVLDCETPNGSGSKRFCPAVKAMSAAIQRTTGCSSKPFYPHHVIPSRPAFTFRRLGRSCTIASVDARRAPFSNFFSSCRVPITTTNTLIIDATILRTHQHSAGARKNSRKRLADCAVDTPLK